MQQLDKSWKKLRTLPNQVQQQVIDFIAFLDEKYKNDLIDEKKPTSDALTNESFIGIWKDRTEMDDSSSFVSTFRKKEWGNK